MKLLILCLYIDIEFLDIIIISIIGTYTRDSTEKNMAAPMDV